jgi:hypothetical protein
MIGRLADAVDLLKGTKGTVVEPAKPSVPGPTVGRPQCGSWSSAPE